MELLTMVLALLLAGEIKVLFIITFTAPKEMPDYFYFAV